jgi:hypothetical protein
MSSSFRWVPTTRLLGQPYDSPTCVLTVFEQRNLNNAFAYDLVPSPTVIAAALKAARRVNDFPTAVRVFEGKENHDRSSPRP